MNVLLSIVCVAAFAAGIVAVARVWAVFIEARPLSEDERDEWFGGRR